MNDPEGGALASSFRDPSGFLFETGGVLYRQVNQRYREDYDALMGSGLYGALVDGGAVFRLGWGAARDRVRPEEGLTGPPASGDA